MAKLEDYELLERLSHLTTTKVHGTLWKARHRPSGSYRAVRVLEFEAASPGEVDDLHRQLSQEILPISEKPGFCPVHHILTSGNEIWIVSSYVASGSAADLPRTRDSSGQSVVSEEVLAAVVRQVLQALATLNGAGKVHGHIKSTNILITSSGDVLLSDYGLSSLEEHFGPVVDASPYWMPPEVVAAGGFSSIPHKIPVDVWSLGITVYEMATRAPPYERYVPRRAATFIKEQRTPNLSALKPYSVELRDFVEKCLQREPLERPTCHQLLRDHPLVARASGSSRVAQHLRQGSSGRLGAVSPRSSDYRHPPERPPLSPRHRVPGSAQSPRPSSQRSATAVTSSSTPSPHLTYSRHEGFSVPRLPLTKVVPRSDDSRPPSAHDDLGKRSFRRTPREHSLSDDLFADDSLGWSSSARDDAFGRKSFRRTAHEQTSSSFTEDGLLGHDDVVGRERSSSDGRGRAWIEELLRGERSSRSSRGEYRSGVGETSSGGPSPRDYPRDTDPITIRHVNDRRPPRSPRPQPEDIISTTPPPDTQQHLTRTGSSGKMRSPLGRMSPPYSVATTSSQPYSRAASPENDISTTLKTIVLPAFSAVLRDVSAAEARQLVDLVGEAQGVLLAADARWPDLTRVLVREVVNNIEQSSAAAVKQLAVPRTPVHHFENDSSEAPLDLDAIRRYLVQRFLQRSMTLSCEVD